MDTLGENHNIELIKARERITEEKTELHKLNEKIKNLNDLHAAHMSSSLQCNCSQELSAIRKQVFDEKMSFVGVKSKKKKTMKRQFHLRQLHGHSRCSCLGFRLPLCLLKQLYIKYTIKMGCF